MNIAFINGDIEITDEGKAQVENRLRLALSRFSSKIARLTVELSATVNPDDKKCRIELFLRPTRRLIAEDADPDLNAAVDRAAQQMARSVERKLRREREK